MIATRRLGKTGLEVSVLTLGSSALAGDTGAAVIGRALDLGINAIELDAGDLELAERIGTVLREAGATARVHIFARIRSLIPFDLPSPHVVADHAYPGAQVRTQTEALLAALGGERLGLVQFHAWCPEWLHEGDWRDAVERLRGEGKIAGFGISLFDHDIEAGQEAIASGAVDAVQAMVNIFDPAATALFGLCQQQDIGVIARAPYYYGALAGADPFAPGDWRHGYFYESHARETAARVGEISGLPDAALRFPLSWPAVSTVAVGMRTPAQVETNVAAAAVGGLDAETLTALARHRWLV